MQEDPKDIILNEWMKYIEEVYLTKLSTGHYNQLKMAFFAGALISLQRIDPSYDCKNDNLIIKPDLYRPILSSVISILESFCVDHNV